VLFLSQLMHSAHTCIGLPGIIGTVITADHTVSLVLPCEGCGAPGAKDLESSRQDFSRELASQLSGRIDEENRLFLRRQEAYRCE